VADILTSQKEALDRRTNQRKVSSQVRTYLSRPVGGLVPSEEVARIVTEEDEAKQKETIGPVQPAALIASCEEDSGQMHDPGNQQNIRSQKMEVSEQTAVSQSCHNVQNPLIGGLLIGDVIKQQRKAG
jgi:hypothetical protein